MPAFSVICTVNNSSAYSFQSPSGSLSHGLWVISPQPFSPGVSGFLDFQADTASGTAAGVTGVVTFEVYNGSNTQAGTLTLDFNDPYNNVNSCSASTTVSGLTAVPAYNRDGTVMNIVLTLT